MAFFSIIGDFGTLILAIATVSALFVPSIIKWLHKPEFTVDFDLHKESNNELRLKVKNVGKSIAHGCKVLIEVYDNDNNTILKSCLLPWEIPNYHIIRSLSNSDNEYPPVTYDVIDLYSQEYQFTKLFFYFSPNHDDENFFSIYGSPYDEGPLTRPPISEKNSCQNGSCLKQSTVYKLSMSIFSLENSKIKDIYFKIIKQGEYEYGFTRDEMKSIRE
jgi:hypothetical protein